MTAPEIADRKGLAEQALTGAEVGTSISELARNLFESHPGHFHSFESARNCLRTAQDRITRRARQGIAPEHDMIHEVAPGFRCKGISTYYDGDGAVRGQWVKTTADEARQREILVASLDALADDLPRQAPIAPPSYAVSPLCNLYTLTDVHLGMMAFEGEGGESWGLEKGERLVFAAFENLMLRSPQADRCIISQLGDFLHSDGLDAVTPQSGHTLDQDARFPEVARAAVRLLRRVVDLGLKTNNRVDLVIAEGNHDLASSLWLRIAFAALYENEPRVTIIDSDLPYYVTTHGNIMLGFHHGHIKNIKSNGSATALALRFATMPEWGKTGLRYVHTGHHHDEGTTEVPGVKLFAHPTFSAADAYAARNFGGSSRQMTSHTYHNEFGLVGTSTVTPPMLHA